MRGFEARPGNDLRRPEVAEHARTTISSATCACAKVSSAVNRLGFVPPPTIVGFDHGNYLRFVQVGPNLLPDRLRIDLQLGDALKHLCFAAFWHYLNTDCFSQLN